MYAMNPGATGRTSGSQGDRTGHRPIVHPEDAPPAPFGALPSHGLHFDGSGGLLGNSHPYNVLDTSPRAHPPNSSYFYDSSFVPLPDVQLGHMTEYTYLDKNAASPRPDTSRNSQAMNVDEENIFYSHDQPPAPPTLPTPSSQPIAGRTRNKETRNAAHHQQDRATGHRDREDAGISRKASLSSKGARNAATTTDFAGQLSMATHTGHHTEALPQLSMNEPSQNLAFSVTAKVGATQPLMSLGHAPNMHSPNNGHHPTNSQNDGATAANANAQRTANNSVNFVVKSSAGKAPVHPIDLSGASDPSNHVMHHGHPQHVLQNPQISPQHGFAFDRGSAASQSASGVPMAMAAHQMPLIQQRSGLSSSTPAIPASRVQHHSSNLSSGQILAPSAPYATFPASTTYPTPMYGGNSMAGTSARTDPGIASLMHVDSPAPAHMTAPLPQVDVTTPRQFSHESNPNFQQPPFQASGNYAPFVAPPQVQYALRQPSTGHFQASHHQRQASHVQGGGASTRLLSASSPAVPNYGGAGGAQPPQPPSQQQQQQQQQETVLWVNYLPLQWNEETIKAELQALLDIHGAPKARILHVALHPQLATESLNRALATITLPTRDDCEQAMQILRHCKVQSKILSISFQQPVRPLESEESLATTKTLFVANVHLSVTEEQIRLLFMQFGEVVSAVVVKNQNSNLSRGFVFVEYAEHASCELALRFLQNENFCGQPLKIKLAKAQTQGMLTGVAGLTAGAGGALASSSGSSSSIAAGGNLAPKSSGSPRFGSASTPTTPTLSSNPSSASSTFSPTQMAAMSPTNTNMTTTNSPATTSHFKHLEPQQRKVVFTVGRKRASSSSSSSVAAQTASTAHMTFPNDNESPRSALSPLSSPHSSASTPRYASRFQEPHSAASSPTSADRRRLSLPTRPHVPGSAASSQVPADYDQQGTPTVPTIWYSSGEGSGDGSTNMADMR